MWAIRTRFEAIQSIKNSNLNNFAKAESAAFHGRKIVEGIAFACLVAYENRFQNIPKEAKGKWNPAVIFKELKKKKVEIIPSPSVLRLPISGESLPSTKIDKIIEGIPENRITHEQLIEIYNRMHVWLHELNPYTYSEKSTFCDQKSQILWGDIDKLYKFLEKHFISINGMAFYCVLFDSQDNGTKVYPLNQVSDLRLNSI